MTREECDKAIDDLKKSEYWSGKLQKYMETYWLPIKKVYLLVSLNYSRCVHVCNNFDINKIIKYFKGSV